MNYQLKKINMAKKILFVEDEERLQKIMKSSLEEAGYDVTVAADGETGFNILNEHKPDLVLLDLILPKKDGFEFLEEMRNKPETKDTPVIVLTNLEEKFDIEKVMSFNVRAYLVKADYKPHEIVDKIKTVLGNEGGVSTT